MKKYTVLSLAATLLLAACGNEPTSVQKTASAPASAASAVAAQTVASSASSVSQIQENGIQFKGLEAYEEKLGDMDLMPEGVSAEQVVLLKSNGNITVTGVKQGQVKTDVASFFANLEKDLKADKGISQLNFVAQEQRVAYSYIMGGVNESCITSVGSDKNITTVCVASAQTPIEALNELLKNAVLPS